MCGIAGLHHLAGKPVQKESVERMGERMRHRGPNDRGLWHSGPIALGHERLSILDLSSRGRNPMANEDETLWLVANGEIYNFKELRAELLKKGHTFKSETDTEVILHLYEEKGPACVEFLNGMFAFALWDCGKRRLVLARDRFGIKPLYYTLLDNTLAFASEAKAFLDLPGFEVRADLSALAEHFTFHNTTGNRTFFRDVRSLPAGRLLICENGQAEEKRYWDLQFEPDETLSLEERGRGLRERFEQAVTRQLMSDVPLGTYLSGGMDTGAISAIAARQISPLHTFTCGFDLPEEATELERFFDEREDSERLARLLNTSHHVLELGPEAMASALPRVVWHLDEPRLGISYQIFHTAEMISRYVTVVLSGVGGDELFAGYPWRYEPVLGLSGSRFEQTYYQLWNRLLTEEEKNKLFTPEVKQELNGFSTFESFSDVLRGTDKNQEALHRALYFDFKVFMSGLLQVEDRLNMAHSVEARVPFLDNELVDYARKIPAAFKLQKGKSKRVLREAMKGLLPEDTLTRRKQGFTPPDETWYRTARQPYVRDLVLGSRALARGYFEPSFLRKILEDHQTGRRNHRFLIWSLLCFEWWNRLFVDRDPLPSPPKQIIEKVQSLK